MKVLKVLAVLFVGLLSLSSCAEKEWTPHDDAYSIPGSVVYVDKKSPFGNMMLGLVNDNMTLTYLNCNSPSTRGLINCLSDDSTAIVNVKTKSSGKSGSYISHMTKLVNGKSTDLSCPQSTSPYDIKCVEYIHIFNHTVNNKDKK